MILRGSLFSQALEMETGISILLPDGPRESEPDVVYLLHGLCGSHATWLSYSSLSVYAAQGNTAYVMPDAARSFYTNQHYGQRYFTYIAEELPEICRRSFQISAGPEKTAVIGSSMGGYGALKCALSHPERFGRCAAFASSTLFLKEGLDALRGRETSAEAIGLWGEQLIRDLHSAFGEELEYHAAHDVAHLAEALAAQPAGLLKKPDIFLTCGTNDPFLADNTRFADLLRTLGYHAEYEILSGGHDFPFFNESLLRAMHYFNL